MKFIVQLIFLGVLLFSTPVFSDSSFRNEVFFAQEHFEVQDNTFGSSFSSDFRTARYTYYFSSVKYSNVPLRELTFLQKSSFVSFELLEIASDDGFMAAIHYVQDDLKFPLFFNASYRYLDRNSGFSPSIDMEDNSLGFGVYIFDNTSISVDFLSRTVDSPFTSSSSLQDSTADGFSFRAKNVSRFNGNHYVSVEALVDQLVEKSVGSSDQTNTFYLGSVTYYPNKSLGIGVDLSKTYIREASIDNYESTLIGVFCDVFFTKNFAVGFQYDVGSSRFGARTFDNTALTIAITGRFGR